MNKFLITKELVKIANYLDTAKMTREANSLTKIAEDMMDEKFDPMVYNPDDEASDSLDAQADDFDMLIDSLMAAQREGDLNDEDIASIMNILEQDSGRKSIEMSYDDDDFELGLGAVPHKKIKSPMNSSDYDDEDGDIDLSLHDDDYDMGPEDEPFDYDSMEDEEDSMYGDDRKGYMDKDSDF